MRARLHRRMIAATLGAGVALTGALTGATAAVAAPPSPSLTATATDLVFGQPGLDGVRSGRNLVTITNRGTSTVEFPVVLIARNGRDVPNAGTGSPECTTMIVRPDADLICIASPLAPGESRVLPLDWFSRSSGPGGPAAARVAEAAGRDGTPLPGTVSSVGWRVRFERLTGTFKVTASALHYGPADPQEVRHGATTVRITNISGAAVEFPLVSFPASSGDASHQAWRGCRTVIQNAGGIVCVLRPLTAGERRAVTFGFHLTGTTQDFDASVRVDAGTGLDGGVVPGTAAGTSYPVTS